MIQSIIGTSFTGGGYNPVTNFDITANWSLTTPAVVDEASFRTFLESGEDGDGSSSDLTDVVITDFLLEGNRLRCNLSATGTDLALNSVGVTEIVSFGNISGLTYIDLGYNSISSLASVTWPIGLTQLSLSSNGILSFNDIVWPSTLQTLSLGENPIVGDFDPINPLPSGLLYLSLQQSGLVNFDPTIPLPDSLVTLDLNSNQIVTFDPSIALPSSLEVLTLSYNQMTTAGYTASESWANSMSVIPNRGTIDFYDNINGVIGTNLESILVSKGWTVEGDIVTNFDITANWSLTTPPVVDASSFQTFLLSGQDGQGNTNNLGGVIVNDFLLEGNRLRCNVSGSGSVLFLTNMGITDITSFGNLQVNQLIMYQNSVTSVDDTVWPINITQITIIINNISSVDNVVWPSSLISLSLGFNPISVFNPINPLPSGLQQLDFRYTQINTFNPTLPLPNSLTSLDLRFSQMTTAGYTASEPWANAMSVVPGRGNVYFNGNVNSVSGTNLKTILIAKGWNVP